jgi:hypothetical protein
LSQLHLIGRSNYVTVIPSSATRAVNIAVHWNVPKSRCTLKTFIFVKINNYPFAYYWW